MKPTFPRTLAGFALVSLFTLSPLLAEESRSFERSFDTGGEVILHNLAGSFEIVPGTGHQIVTRVEVHAEGDSAAETRDLLDGMEWVRYKDGWALSYPVDEYDAFTYPQRSGFGSSSSKYLGERVKVYGRSRGDAPILYADLRIEMPAGARLTVDGVVGPMTTRGRLQGELTLDTGSGQVEVESFDGELVVDTGSGDVEVSDVYGSLSVDTGSGSVEISGLELSSLHVDTGSGDVFVTGGRADRVLVDTGSGEVIANDLRVVDFEADTGSGDVTLIGDLSAARELRFDTGSGDVRIEGGRDFEFDLDADLGSGRVIVDYDDADLRYDGREVVGARRGAAGTLVRVDTGSGDCVLR